MAGVKRRTPYRKVVTDDVLYGTPLLSAGQRIAIVVRSQGGNLLEVQTDGADVGLAMLPTKFRKLIWIKRGDFLVVSEAAGNIETADGSQGSVRFLIETVLYPDAIKDLKKAGKWPSAFTTIATPGSSSGHDTGRGRGLPPSSNDGGECEDDSLPLPAGGNARRQQQGRSCFPPDDDDDGAEELDDEQLPAGSDEGDAGSLKTAWEVVTDKFGNTTRRRMPMEIGSDVRSDVSPAQEEAVDQLSTNFSGLASL